MARTKAVVDDDVTKKPLGVETHEPKSKTEPAKSTAHPVDRGWAWVIMLCTFCTYFLTIGYFRTFGILFVEFQKKFESTSAMTSTISGVQCVFYSLTTLIVVNIGMKHLSVRKICMAGCIVEALAVALNGVVSDIRYLLLTQGFLYGCGQALIYCPSIVILSAYFNKRRPIATAVSACGVGMGGFAFPPMVRYLVDNYGLMGGQLLLAGVMLQQAVFVSFFTSPEDYYFAPTEKIPMSKDSVHDESTEAENRKLGKSIHSGYSFNDNEDTQKESSDNVRTVSTLNEDSSHLLGTKKDWNDEERSTHETKVDLNAENNLPTKEKTAHQSYDHRSRKRTEPHAEDTTGINLYEETPDNSPSGLHYMRQMSLKDTVIQTLSTSNIDIYGLTSVSQETVPHGNSLLNQQSSQEDTDDIIITQKGRSRWRCRLPLLAKTLSFWILAIFFSSGGIGSALPTVYLPPLAEEKGLGEYSAVFLMASAVTETIGRIIPGVVLHFGFLKPSTVIIAPMLVNATMYHFVGFFNTFTAMLVMSLICGCFAGCFWTNQSLLVIELFGLEKLGPALGFYSILVGFSVGGSYPLSGSLRDISGNYSATYHYFGAIYYLAVIMLVLVHFTKGDKMLQ